MGIHKCVAEIFGTLDGPHKIIHVTRRSHNDSNNVQLLPVKRLCRKLLRFGCGHLFTRKIPWQCNNMGHIIDLDTCTAGMSRSMGMIVIPSESLWNYAYLRRLIVAMAASLWNENSIKVDAYKNFMFTGLGMYGHALVANQHCPSDRHRHTHVFCAWKVLLSRCKILYASQQILPLPSCLWW